jgi:hypothetical protein
MTDTPSTPSFPGFDPDHPKGQPSDYDKMLLILVQQNTALNVSQSELLQKMMMEIARLHLKIKKLEDKIDAEPR